MKIRMNDLIPAPHSTKPDRRLFIGGSDARIIMSPDEAALIRLWKEKRGEVEPMDLSDNLVVQLGVVTEALNRSWYERNTGRSVTDCQRWVQHPVKRWMAATLDGFVNELDAVFEAKFALPWSFSEEAAAEKHMAQLQHNMWVTNARSAVLSIITGGGKWIEMTIPADALYQHFLVTAERRFWRCVQTGETPRPYGDRAASAADRGGPDRRHERVQFVGRVRRPLLLDPLRLSRPRASQGRTQGPDARGRQGSLRPWRSGQTLEVGRGQLRSSRPVGRAAMQRSSETIGAIAAALAKAQAELTNPEKALVATIRASNPRDQRSDLSLCGALERPRHRAQGAWRARDRDRSDDGDRQRGGTHPPHHHARPFVRGVAVVGMAGLPDCRDGGAAPDGGGAHLRTTLRALHPGRHRRRGRSRRAGP